jgi:hypothetical protein
MAARKKKQLPPIQVPTISFYSHRGFVDQMQGTVMYDDRKDKNKGPVLVAMSEDGLPIIANSIKADYRNNIPEIEVVWSGEEGKKRSPAEFEAMGFPLTLVRSMWGLPTSYTTLIQLGQKGSIIESQRAIQNEVARRFRITSEKPTLMWMLLHPDPGAKKMNPHRSVRTKRNPMPFKVSGVSPLTGGDEHGVADVTFVRPENKAKKWPEMPIPVRFEYDIQGPDARGNYTYHAHYFFLEPGMAGAIPGLPGTLLEDGVYTLTEMRAPSALRNRTVARQIGQSTLEQAAAYVDAAVKRWHGIPAGLLPGVVTVARPFDIVTVGDLMGAGVPLGPEMKYMLQWAQEQMDLGHNQWDILDAVRKSRGE